MNMRIYAHELDIDMDVVASDLGQGRVRNAALFASVRNGDPDYVAVALDGPMGRVQVGVLLATSVVEIEPINDGLNDPIDIQ